MTDAELHDFMLVAADVVPQLEDALGARLEEVHPSLVLNDIKPALIPAKSSLPQSANGLCCRLRGTQLEGLWSEHPLSGMRLDLST